MAGNEEVEIVGTTNDHIIERLLDKEHGHESAMEYLKADFLTAAAISLFILNV